MRRWWSKVRVWMTGRAEIDNDVAEEVRSHVEMEAAALMERGIAPDAARAAARRHFGNATAVAERAHDAWTFTGIENVLQDVRYGIRAMLRSPAFSLVVILTFALGVGVNTAIFSVVDAVLIKPLPYPDADRLVWLREGNAKGQFSLTWGNFNYWRDGNHVFEDMAAFQGFGGTLTGRGDAVATAGKAVTASYYPLLGIHPLLGRVLGQQDDLPGAPATIVLSHPFWARQFGGDTGIVGQSILLDGKPYEVAGVAAPTWDTWGRVDYYVSLGRLAGKPTKRGQHGSISGLGRLKSNVTVAAARSDLDAIMRHLAEIDPGPEADHHSTVSLVTKDNASDIRGTLLILMGAAALILLIACANVAGLLLARNTARTGELALRKAIGAGQIRLVRQLLTENVVIALAGGMAGIVFASFALRLLIGIAPGDIPRLAETGLDLRALFFACAITLAAGVLAGLAPVLMAGKIDLASALKESSRTAGSGKRRQSFRNVLVLAEVAITLILAFGSGLLLRSLIAAQNSNPGFDARRLLTFSLDLPSKAYRDPEAIRQFYTSLADNLRRVPGTVDVSAVRCPPPEGDCGDWFYSVPGRPVPARDQVPISLFNSAFAGYFHMMGIPMRQGREFNDADREESAVAVINETLARTWWPHESAVGHQIK